MIDPAVQTLATDPTWAQKLVRAYELCEPEIMAQFLKNKVSPAHLKSFISELRTMTQDEEELSMTKKEATEFLLQCIDMYENESWFRAGVTSIVAGPQSK